MKSTNITQPVQAAPARQAQAGRSGIDEDQREALETLPSAQERSALKREIERLTRESKDALAVVEEIYGDTVPDMLLVPQRVVQEPRTAGTAKHIASQQTPEAKTDI